MTTLTLPHASTRPEARLPLAVGVAWFALVVIGAETGFFASLYQPAIGAIVAATIILPTVWYFRAPGVRAAVEAVGHRRIMAMHTWRVPAALLFFWYGFRGDLPPAFWALAGAGDLVAGLYAGYLSFKPESAARYRSFHRFGFADFVVAVGVGLTHTLISDPRMAPVTTLPLALIPFFGVGVSGASHLVAFDMLRRGVGFSAPRAV